TLPGVLGQQGLVPQLVDLGVVELGGVEVTGFHDRVAVRDLGAEAVAGRPVRSPAGDAQTDVVLPDKVLRTGVLAEELTVGVALDVDVDADAGQGLLQGHGRLDVALAAVTDGDVGAESVGLTALLKFFLGRVEVTGVVLGRVQVEVGLCARDQRREEVGGDVAAVLTAPGTPHAVAVGGVHDRLAAGHVLDDRGVDVDVTQRARVRVVQVTLNAFVVHQFLVHAGRDPGASQVDVDLTVDQALVDLVLVDTDLELDAVGQGLTDRVAVGVPVLVAFQVQLHTGLVGSVELVRAGGHDVLLVQLTTAGVG